MIIVKCVTIRRFAHVPYTVIDWRLDVLATGRCLPCRREVAVLPGPGAECTACGRWFDGYLCGSIGEEDM